MKIPRYFSSFYLCFLGTLFFCNTSSAAPKTTSNKSEGAKNKVLGNRGKKPSGLRKFDRSSKIELPALSTNSNTQTEMEESDRVSIWDSEPEEITTVNIQILDKVSGKVIKRRVEVGQPLEFGGIKVTLSRCFRSAPEDPREIYAFIEISERRPIFSRWLFASSPAINLFKHPQYDVRVEF